MCHAQLRPPGRRARLVAARPREVDAATGTRRGGRAPELVRPRSAQDGDHPRVSGGRSRARIGTLADAPVQVEVDDPAAVAVCALRSCVRVRPGPGFGRPGPGGDRAAPGSPPPLSRVVSGLPVAASAPGIGVARHGRPGCTARAAATRTPAAAAASTVLLAAAADRADSAARTADDRDPARGRGGAAGSHGPPFAPVDARLRVPGRPAGHRGGRLGVARATSSGSGPTGTRATHSVRARLGCAAVHLARPEQPAGLTCSTRMRAALLAVAVRNRPI